MSLPAITAGTDPEVGRRLLALNDPRYLAHKHEQVAAIAAYGRAHPGPWQLVEVGSNRGVFALGLARAHPNATVLALEWREKWVDATHARAHHEQLANLHCLRADCRIALPMLVPTASLQALFVLYPDPWWKRRHEHRRLLDLAFFEVAAELLGPGGLLLIKTDVRLNAERVTEAVGQVGLLAPLDPWEWPDERVWALSTREEQCLRAGIATYRLYFRRL